MGRLGCIVLVCIVVTVSAADESSLKKLLERLIRTEDGLQLNERSSCRYPAGHSACLDNPRRRSEGVSASDRSVIIKKHNTLRAGVKPAATDMQTMRWNYEIAMIAQKWASNCHWGHDKGDARRTIKKEYVGQNLAFSTYPKNWANQIQSWYNEVKDFKYGYGSINGKAVGHYTQVVWAKSNQIGCGYAYCPHKSGKYYFHYYVCNYLPGGNMNSWNENANEPYKRVPESANGDGNSDKDSDEDKSTDNEDNSNENTNNEGNNNAGNNNGGSNPSGSPSNNNNNNDWAKKEGCNIDGHLVPAGQTRSWKSGNWTKSCTCTMKKVGNYTSWSYRCSYSM